MHAFFDLLRERGLSPDRIVETMNKLTRTQALDLVNEVRASLPYTLTRGSEQHSFAANISLSAGPFPCGHPGCRIDKADDLARFAALYADRVLMRDPFSVYDEDFGEGVLKVRLGGDFLVLFYLEPLLVSGLIGIGSPVLPFCETHRLQEDDIAHFLRECRKKLQRMYLGELTFKYEDSSNHVAVTGPDFIVPHEEQLWGPLGKDVVTRKGSVRMEVKRRIFNDMLVGPAIQDVIEQGAYARHSQYTYLTDRELDRELIASLTNDEVRPLANALVNGLSHAVPVIESADLKSLLRLREEEGEAFRVYRDAVASVLRDADLSSERRIKEAFADAIQPELNRIDLAVRNSKKLVSDHLTRELVIGAGMISIGLFIGAVQPAAGAVFAALGGGKFVSELGKRVYDAARPDTSEIRDNSFYYLWQLRRNSEISQASVEKRWF